MHGSGNIYSHFRPLLAASAFPSRYAIFPPSLSLSPFSSPTAVSEIAEIYIGKFNIPTSHSILRDWLRLSVHITVYMASLPPGLLRACKTLYFHLEIHLCKTALMPYEL